MHTLSQTCRLFQSFITLALCRRLFQYSILNPLLLDIILVETLHTLYQHILVVCILTQPELISDIYWYLCRHVSLMFSQLD